MFDLEDIFAEFPVARKWPPADPGAIQLYSVPTPNGIKVSAMLEELGLAYEPHLVRFADKEQYSEAFRSLNPNARIPAIIDPDGPNGRPVGIFESGAILLYLAEKTGRLLPADPGRRLEAIQWLMWQVAAVGPMFGQFGWFWVGGGAEFEDQRPMQRYMDETRRLLGVLETRLDGRRHVAGQDYSIADIAIWPWYRILLTHYDSAEDLGLADFPRVGAWYERCSTRPASLRAVNIPARD